MANQYKRQKKWRTKEAAGTDIHRDLFQSKAFIALKPGYEPSAGLELKIMNHIRKKLSPLAMPQEIEFLDKLPKTRSGKIMRRLLRAKEWGEEIGDTSTLEDE